MTRKTVVHSTHVSEVPYLANPELYTGERGYVCCSSLGCSEYLVREVLVLLEGEVVEEFAGDIGFSGGSARPTTYDEIHLADGFEFVGLYVPKNHARNWNLEAYAAAKYLLQNFHDVPIVDVVFEEEDPEAAAKIAEYEDRIYSLSEEELQEFFAGYGVEL